MEEKHRPKVGFMMVSKKTKKAMLHMKQFSRICRTKIITIFIDNQQQKSLRTSNLAPNF